jgi:hypothetical protein
MEIGKHLQLVIDDSARGEYDSALMHACIAFDGTAKKVYPSLGVGARFKTLFRESHWIIEPLGIPGINLDESFFLNVPLDKAPRPDLADVMYHAVRCSHTHGDVPPAGIRLSEPEVPGINSLTLADGHFHLPACLPFGLLVACVLHPVNTDQTAPDGYFFSLGPGRYPLNDWWGHADGFRHVADRHNQVRVTLTGLGDGWHPESGHGL